VADSPLQKAAFGLLGLFDLKQLGQNPTVFAETVVPMADVSDFYGAPLQQFIGATTALAQNHGDTVSLTVPSGFVYRVHAIAASVSTGNPITSADGIAVAVQVGVPAAFVTLAYEESPLTAPAAGSASLTAAYAGKALVLPPGTTMSAVLLRTFSAAVELRVRALVEPLLS